MTSQLNSRLLSFGAILGTSVLLMGCGGSSLINRLSNFWGYGLCSGIIVILDIVALIEVFGSNRSTGDKLLWTLLIIFAPFVGCLLYYFFGRK